MSNVAVFNPGQLPAHLRSVGMSETAKALAGGGQTGNRLSIKGGVFRLVVDGKEIAAIEERYLDIVIVAAAPKVSRTFYMAKYDPDTSEEEYVTLYLNPKTDVLALRARRGRTVQ